MQIPLEKPYPTIQLLHFPDVFIHAPLHVVEHIEHVVLPSEDAYLPSAHTVQLDFPDDP